MSGLCSRTGTDGLSVSPQQKAGSKVKGARVFEVQMQGLRELLKAQVLLGRGLAAGIGGNTCKGRATFRCLLSLYLSSTPPGRQEHLERLVCKRCAKAGNAALSPLFPTVPPFSPQFGLLQFSSCKTQ